MAISEETRPGMARATEAIAPPMMEVPLTTWLLFDHAGVHHAATEIVSRLPSGELHRYTYGEFSGRAQQLMHALDRLGIERGERVATLAWNGYRHLELYFAVPCSGRVLHTLNLRLSPEDLTYIIRHADDRAIFVDADLVPLLERIPEALAGVEHVVVMGEVPAGTTLPNLRAYEDLIGGEPTTYPRPALDERAVCGICYTSGTTGRPKGAAYTHRSTVLHALMSTSGAAFGMGPQDCVMPIVPMFHVNAWGLPLAATAVGAKQVFCGSHLDPKSVADLLEDEAVTLSAGVPTVWLTVLDELVGRGRRPHALRFIVCGGSQPPRQMIERYREELDIPIVQAWGMTETSPLASMAHPQHRMRDWDEDRLTDAVRSQAGLPIPGVEVSIRDAEGNEVPRDGSSMGALLVRGPWVAASYLRGDGAEQFTGDGWFRTGDVAVASPEGYFVIADRTKDLIKSGGEWISSVDMEGAIMAMPGVAEAAVIAIPDPKWQERPLACVVPRPGGAVTLEEVRRHLLAAGFAHWQLPDRVEVIEAVPRTSVGKFDKKALRVRFPA
jgi:fatty-acyl-CoA synthase